ncbi:GTP cyclohydrolase I [Micromonospora sp. NBC_01813]|uniref:GTP cyclohydrolase I n=1 Tax=Micromonospora sp. NBC_01813 TaxID=2975988 RepID=UPI002DDC7211|nr:GTP cyclohydrolase I [Micromonospora sp. NBC_01813]WSA06853.1 GTP cyclohydrolase I [Micromonospora sp. NBC_01813]
MTAAAEPRNGALVATTLGSKVHQAAPIGLGFDNEAAETAAAALLAALGIELDNEHMRATPARLTSALREMLTPPRFDPTSFENTEGYDQLVVVEAVPFYSLCEHHVLPFSGTATLAYLPGPRLVGLSKLAWVVQMFARRLQVQERMTAQIADWLVENLEPRGVGVQLRAEHLCMSLRGVRASGAVTTTSARRGALLDEPDRRQEWLHLTSPTR